MGSSIEEILNKFDCTVKYRQMYDGSRYFTIPHIFHLNIQDTVLDFSSLDLLGSIIFDQCSFSNSTIIFGNLYLVTLHICKIDRTEFTSPIGYTLFPSFVLSSCTLDLKEIKLPVLVKRLTFDNCKLFNLDGLSRFYPEQSLTFLKCEFQPHPQMFSRVLQKVQYLCIDHCQLSILSGNSSPLLIGEAPNLVKLELHGLTQLPTLLYELPQLKELVLRNFLNPINVNQINSILQEMPELVDLDLYGSLNGKLELIDADQLASIRLDQSVLIDTKVKAYYRLYNIMIKQ